MLFASRPIVKLPAINITIYHLGIASWFVIMSGREIKTATRSIKILLSRVESSSGIESSVPRTPPPTVYESGGSQRPCVSFAMKCIFPIRKIWNRIITKMLAHQHMGRIGHGEVVMGATGRLATTIPPDQAGVTICHQSHHDVETQGEVSVHFTPDGKVADFVRIGMKIHSNLEAGKVVFEGFYKDKECVIKFWPEPLQHKYDF